jgi:two-component system, chemotaxis family, protein-glutamate methylesterase/glutaminase
MPIKVLLVDDSALIRGLISQAIGKHPEIAVTGRAANGAIAIALAEELQPDIIILDIEMPVMDGLTALPGLLKAAPRTKVIIASVLTERNAAISLQALSLGASDYLSKPDTQSGSHEHFYRELILKICALGGISSLQPIPESARPALLPLSAGEKLNPGGIEALAIAASTGGPQALTTLFAGLKGHLASIPIFITQHMPPTFTTIMAEQLAVTGERICHEASDGERVQPGEAYVARGNFHMLAQRDGEHVILRTSQEPPEHFCRPAADPMLRSLSHVYGSQLAALILTGMGHDGTEGAKEVIRMGGNVIAQDEASCIVYGMPKSVAERGLCKVILPLGDMAGFLIRQIDEGR